MTHPLLAQEIAGLGMKWFRLYDDLVFNSKVQALPPRLFKHLLNLWCLASRNDPRGYLPSLDRISFALRMRPERVSDVLQSLTKLGFLSELGQIHDWDALQYDSDDSALLKRVQRNNKIAKNVPGQSRECPVLDSDTEQSQKQNRADTEQNRELTTAEKRVGVPDPAYELFVGKHKEFTGTAYVSKTADFVQMVKLRKANQLVSRESPNRWPDAVENYFASPLAAWTLADLCTRFAVFCNSAVDRYQKPVNHRGNKNGSRNDMEEIVRYNREQQVEFDQQLFGSAWDGPGSEDS